MTPTREHLDEWVRSVVEYADHCGVTDQLRAALVSAPVLHSHPSFPSGPSAHPAGADEPEADPPQTVAADPSIIDSESDPSYARRVESHDSNEDTFGRGGASTRDSGEGVPSGSHRDAPGKAAYFDWPEHERQAWLRRVQAQPIER